MRRSFASNYYGKIETPLLMNITGHSKESTFLSLYWNPSKQGCVSRFIYADRPELFGNVIFLFLTERVFLCTNFYQLIKLNNQIRYSLYIMDL